MTSRIAIPQLFPKKPFIHPKIIAKRKLPTAHKKPQLLNTPPDKPTTQKRTIASFALRNKKPNKQTAKSKKWRFYVCIYYLLSWPDGVIFIGSEREK